MLWGKFCKKLSEKYNVHIDKLGGYHSRLNGIVIENITISKKRISIDVENLEIKFFKRKSTWMIIQCKQVTLRSRSCSDSPTTGNPSEKPIQVINLHNSIGHFISEIYQRIFSYCILTIRCFKVQRAETDFFDVREVSIHNSRIYGEIKNIAGKFFSTYVIRCMIRPDTVNYTLRRVDLKSSDVWSFSKSSGKISWIGDRQVSISNHARESFVAHPMVCSERIQIAQLNTYLSIDIAENGITLNGDSHIKVNDVVCNMSSQYDTKDSDFISLTLLANFTPEAIIALIPTLKMQQLSKLRSTGSVGLRIMFAYLRSNPLSYSFKLDYDTENFAINDPGVQLDYLNADFKTSALTDQDKMSQNDIHVKTHCDFDKALFSKVIQFTEDPNFYKHIGVDPHFLGRAIAINLSQRKFVKGASTITMQLVKNLFLDSNKNLVRKVEEMILTLLIENYFKVPKDRILEIYLQIISFAPNVYGIREATNFYFEKDIMKLTLMEALVLSYIIPRPNFFLDALKEKSIQLDRNLSAHIKHYFPFFYKQDIDKEFSQKNDTIFFNKQIGPFYLKNLNI